MTQTVEMNLADILNRLDQKIDKLSEDVNRKIDKLSEDVNRKIDKLSEDINQLQVSVSTLSSKVEANNKRLDDISKRIDETNARLNTMTLGFLGILGILVTGLLTALGKLVFFPNV